MAGEFLRSHGIDIDAEMSRIQAGGNHSSSKTPQTRRDTTESRHIANVSLPNTPANTTWDLEITDSHVSKISQHEPAANNTQTHGSKSGIDGHGALLAPSLCHPHIHLDKAFLLSHPRHSHLQLSSRGDFAEAMSLTSEAKANFTPLDLLERGQRLIDESIEAGVTHMRAFVEVDAGVGMKCLEAGLELKRRAEGRCVVQICAFAQLPLFTPSPGDDEEGKEGAVIRELMEQAAAMEGVDVVGSTPYVEGDRGRMQRNVRWLVDLSKRKAVHLDFHLDYNLDPDTEPMVWYVIETLRGSNRNRNKTTPTKTVVLGHCTRLTLFDAMQWQKLASSIKTLKETDNIPIHFVGLPTSDLFMMRTPDRTRGTLPIPSLIRDHDLNACIGINNIGNAFTPQGSCDPLLLACQGVGVYSAGTQRDAEVLFEAVSTRARKAIGLSEGRRRGKGEGRDREREGDVSLEVREGDEVNFVLFGADQQAGWRTRKTVSEAVYMYDSGRGRRVVRGSE